MITTAEDLFAAIGREVDLSDDRTVREVLFADQQLPTTAPTADGPSLELDELKKLHAQTENPVLGFIIDTRERR